MTTYKSIKYNISGADLTGLTAGQIPNLDTAKITTGTFADARISESSVTAHVTATDLQPLKTDITALALREATNEASAAFNLPNQFIETFTDATNLVTLTDASVTSGYGGTFYTSHNAIDDFRIYISGAIGVVYDTQGSSDDSDWTTLDTGWDMTGASTGWNANTFTNATGYRYYRLYKTNAATGGGNHMQLAAYDDVTQITITSGMLTLSGFQAPNNTNMVDGNTATYAGYTDTSPAGSFIKMDFGAGSSASSATGTFIQSANTVASAKTKVGGTMLYKDNEGTATLGTDLKIYFSCNNGGAWEEAASYNAITPVYSTGIKQVRLGETTCTSGTGVIYKAVWANQASGSKETQLHGIGINY